MGVVGVTCKEQKERQPRCSGGGLGAPLTPQKDFRERGGLKNPYTTTVRRMPGLPSVSAVLGYWPLSIVCDSGALGLERVEILDRF